MELIIIGSILFSGAIGYGIGARYKRPEAGLLWGILLGPIGWIVILAAGETK